MFISIIFIILGFILLVKGADYLVEGSSQIAKKFHIPEIIIGLTIVSIGTSLPELMVSLTSALENHSDMAIGNVVGSNISNLFLILGACAVIKPLKFKSETVLFEIPFLVLITSMLYIFGNSTSKGIITRQEGLILVILCVLFIIYNIWIAKRNSNDIINKLNHVDDNNANNTQPIFKSIINIIIGIIALKFGGDFVVNSASDIATRLGISEKIVSLTIVSISTSLPELITSITATMRKEMDMAIGNIIGSSILNVVFIIGVCAVINPITYSVSYNRDMIIFLTGVIVLAIIPYLGEKNKISRWSGLGYVISYISYIASLIHVNFL